MACLRFSSETVRPRHSAAHAEGEPRGCPGNDVPDSPVGSLLPSSSRRNPLEAQSLSQKQLSFFRRGRGGVFLDLLTRSFHPLASNFTFYSKAQRGFVLETAQGPSALFSRSESRFGGGQHPLTRPGSREALPSEGNDRKHRILSSRRNGNTQPLRPD